MGWRVIQPRSWFEKLLYRQREKYPLTYHYDAPVDVRPEDFMANDEIDEELTDHINAKSEDDRVQELLSELAELLVPPTGISRMNVDFERIRYGEGYIDFDITLTPSFDSRRIGS